MDGRDTGDVPQLLGQLVQRDIRLPGHLLSQAFFGLAYDEPGPPRTVPRGISTFGLPDPPPSLKRT